MGRGHLRKLFFFFILPISSTVSAANDLNYSIWRERQALIAATQAALGATNNLGRAVLEKQKINYLKNLVDEAVGDVGNVYSSAQSIDGQCEDGFTAMTDMVKGGHNSTSADKILGLLNASFIEQKDYMDRIETDQQSLQRHSASYPSENYGLNKSVTGYLNTANSALKETEARISVVQDSLERMRSRLREGDSLVQAIRKSLRDISSNATAMGPAAADARAKIDALGIEPEAVQRSRAVQTLDQLYSLVSAIFTSSDILSHRSDEFAHAWSEFQKSKIDFSDANDDAKSKLREAKSGLDQASRAFSDFKSNH